MKRTGQISESLRLGAILALSGGFMDAYSYICRDEVFANAQTGNILLFGVHLSTGNFADALRYFFPVLAFSLGIALANILRHPLKNHEKIHWRQITVLAQVIILALVAFIPLSHNLLANSLISFACGVQVESFKKIRGNSIATTMCIGNLRSATQLMSDRLFHKDPSLVKKSLLYYAVIGIFTLGAVLGNLCVGLWQEKAILVSSALLFIGFLMMFIPPRKESDISM